MLKRIGHILLIVAVLAATGMHWLVLQSVAWSTMLMDNLQTRPMVQAVGRTFDGKHPCDLCKLIDKVKQTDKKSDRRVEWKKLEFSYAPSLFVFNPPSFNWESGGPNHLASPKSHAPPVPPPKALLG